MDVTNLSSSCGCEMTNSEQMHDACAPKLSQLAYCGLLCSLSHFQAC